MYTKIDSLIWMESRLKNLDPLAKLTYFYLLTTKHRNNVGIYHLPLAYAASDLNVSEDCVLKALMELIGSGYIDYDGSCSVVLLREYLFHNPLENINQAKAGVKCIEALPKSPLIIDFVAQVGVYAEQCESEPCAKLLEMIIKKFNPS